ncbi:acetoacetate decarboxylase family protein [Capillimicrobium parvum]|nr:acetoacetate decarboxylase family protein [Capillimicrobium parvum]
MTFSGPTWGGLIPAPPHFYRNSKNLLISYETHLDPVLDLLPEEVEPLSDAPRVVLWFQDTPFSTWGPHQGCYAFIECVFRGNPYFFEAFLWVTSDSALAAGRELWGDSKKLADISVDCVAEEIVASLERPTGCAIATARMRLERWGDPDALPAHPGLCLKIIPGAERGQPPAVLQLVRDDMAAHAVVGSDGRPEVYTGPATLTLGTQGALDPLASLTPIGPIEATYALMHVELDYGTILKDYHDPSIGQSVTAGDGVLAGD